MEGDDVLVLAEESFDNLSHEWAMKFVEHRVPMVGYSA